MKIHVLPIDRDLKEKFAQSFASRFIPVFRDAKTKHSRLVTSLLCFTQLARMTENPYRTLPLRASFFR